ncbi:MAG: sulfite exporter TauE/SafE family protein [Chlamydiia bacterium]|nr:sulfite exporter TauE/SafE family protein [Chlamydiia bacterium]
MTLLMSLLPVYLVGNFHCLGMCGPLVAVIGRHPFRHYYFVGRITSFTLAGGIAGGVGSVLTALFHFWQIDLVFTFGLALFLYLIALFSLMHWSVPGGKRLAKKLKPFHDFISLWLLRETPLTTFLFGFFTLALPCGQTLLVFSACALSGDPVVGAVNGFAFALLTSPSLWLAMHASHLLTSARSYYSTALGVTALLAGTLLLFKGLAEMGIIAHFVLFPKWHIVIW